MVFMKAASVNAGWWSSANGTMKWRSRYRWSTFELWDASAIQLPGTNQRPGFVRCKQLRCPFTREVARRSQGCAHRPGIRTNWERMEFINRGNLSFMPTLPAEVKSVDYGNRGGIGYDLVQRWPLSAGVNIEGKLSGGVYNAATALVGFSTAWTK